MITVKKLSDDALIAEYLDLKKDLDDLDDDFLDSESSGEQAAIDWMNDRIAELKAEIDARELDVDCWREFWEK